MFHVFRSRKSVFRIILAIIVAPIIITMVVTMIPGIGGGTSSDGGVETVLADVGGEAVTFRDTQVVYQQYQAQRMVPPGGFSVLGSRILQDLIADKAMLQEAERLKLTVTEQELADHLRTELPFLFPSGSFLGKDQYALFVQDRFQKTIPEFEAEIKRLMIVDLKLRGLVTDGVIVSKEDVDREFRRRNEKAKVEYATISLASVQSSVSSTPAEVEDFFKNNRGLYTIPERRSVQYMIIDNAKVAEKVQVSQQELQRYFDQNRERFRVADRAHATHILLKTTEKNEEEIKKIEARAQDILKQARAGKDFAELAKTYSEDTVSAAKGGDLSWLTRGQTVPEFEQKAFSMKPGEISDLVKTQYGFHVIKLLERETARQKAFSEVEAAIRDEVSRDRIESERSRLADRARTAASRSGVKLPDAAREVGLSAETVTSIEKTTPLPEIGNDPGVLDALFNAPKGSVVGPITTATRSIIAVVTDISPTRQAELNEVQDRVKSDANAARAREVMLARAKELAEKTKAYGGDLRRAAREMRAEVKTSELFSRETPVPGLGSGAQLAEAFGLPVGAVFGPVAGGVDQAVCKVLQRLDADLSAVTADERKAVREQMLGSRQQEAFEVFKDELRARMIKEGKIKIHQDRVDQFINRART